MNTLRHFAAPRAVLKTSGPSGQRRDGEMRLGVCGFDIGTRSNK